MPQVSPAGGLSLIIHILINVVIFAYRNIINFLGIPNTNFLTNNFNKLTNKEGDKLPRKIMSYLIVILIFLAMSGNFILIVYGLIQKNDFVGIDTFRSSKTMTQENSSEAQNIESIYYSINLPKPLASLNILTISSAPYNMNKSTQPTNISLVDFLKSLGIVDTSFNARAELAKELGIVKNIDEYTGSPKQNRLIINKVNKALVSNDL